MPESLLLRKANNDSGDSIYNYGSRLVSSNKGESKKFEMLIPRPWQISWITRSFTESYAQLTILPIEDLGTPLFIYS